MASFLREEFEHDPLLAYLNWGTHSMTPLRIIDAIQRYQREYETNPTQGYIESFGRMWDVQKELAGWLRADAHDLFLRANVSEAMNAFILGMVLEPGCEILHSDLEYGAMIGQCRFRAERDGLSLRSFEFPAKQTTKAGELVDAVVAALGPKTRMLVLSHIISSTGLVMPIGAIAAETRKRGVLLAVDGAHAPGTIPLDFSSFGDVDFYGGNLHKWFMGPKGTAFGWLNKRHQSRMMPLSAGWTTYDRRKPFSDFGDGNEFQLKHLLGGCRDFAPFYAIHDTISFWTDHGDSKLREELYKVTDEFRARVIHEVSLEPVSPPPGPLRGPAAAFALPKDTEIGPLLERLRDKHHVQFNAFMGRGVPVLRATPHFSTSEDELERGLDAIKAELTRL